MKRLLLVGLSAVALVACGNADDGTPTAAPESTAAPGILSVTPMAPPSIGAPPIDGAAPVPAPGLLPTADAAPEAQPAEPAPCISMGSPLVSDALASLPSYFDGVPWVAYDMGDPCAPFTYIAATVEGATASSPDHFLFFAGGVYLGTATAQPYPFSSVVGQMGDTVTIAYGWLLDGDANAAPSGGPAVIDYQWDGSSVTMLGDLPVEVTG